MGLSETIVAAMIGAAATIMTATFQLLMAMRGRAKAESRPKRGSAMRSIVTLAVIVLASAVGGFAYSELRAERVREDTVQLRMELADQLKELSTSTERLEHFRSEVEPPAGAAAPVALAGAGTAEAILRLHPCRAEPISVGVDPPKCDEATAERVALCTAIPVPAKISGVELFAKADDDLQSWGDQSKVQVNQDAGGTRFADAPYDQMQGSDHRSLCINLAHWSSDHGHVARLLVHYTTAAPVGVQTAVARSQ
ncbi:MAG TPA: hypothetical protein VKB41_06180 [Steroidobacteraceae bacterium]|jgi:hypothetical protein|nr:hypothetical protein [Steroidobacteraceae bacterium]